MSEALCKLGVIGLTTAGQSLAAHHAAEKTRICVCDDDVTFVPQVIKEYKTQMEAGENAVGGAASAGDARASRCMLPSSNMEELVARLEQPRKIIIFGTNGDDNKFQDYWNKLSKLVEKDDMILRWGREEEGNDMNLQFYNNSIVGNLSKMQAKPKGIHLLEMIRLQRDRIVIFQGETTDVFSVGGNSRWHLLQETLQSGQRPRLVNALQIVLMQPILHLRLQVWRCDLRDNRWIRIKLPKMVHRRLQLQIQQQLGWNWHPLVEMHYRHFK